MGVIRELPPSVVNQIAAGEVVERPASVVKELLENAIDAGATRVELAVERGGKDLIRVSDNGRGMTREDLPLAFRPHATSKLSSAEDLSRIRTLGFRGEALASIAEIAKVRCQTCAVDESIGSELSIEAGMPAPIKDAPGVPGTTIEVRNLFFNTPVRRTFLKSDSTEASHVSEMFARLAIAHPSVHFTFRSGGRVQHDLPADVGLKERIAAFQGRELADALLWVESRHEGICVRGYVGHPSQSRSNSKSQYLFIGGRYVRDRSLGHALSEAYRGLLMVGRQPVAFLFLDIPPEEVDVNVHPSKIEVRFRDGHRVYSQVLSTIRQTFLASDLHARLQVSDPDSVRESPARESGISVSRLPTEAGPALELWPGSVDRQQVAAWFQPASKTAPSSHTAGRPAAPAVGLRAASPVPACPEWVEKLPPAPSPSPLPFDETDPTLAETVPLREAPCVASSLPSDNRSGDGPQVAARAHPPAQHTTATRALQVHNSYLIAETEDGLVVIDQHALHERILYEELRARLEQGAIESQRLLAPEPVELSASGAAALLEQSALLRELGLEIEPFGGSTVLVAGQPALLARLPAERLVRDLADHFLSQELPPTREALLERVLSSIACKAAVKAGDRLNPEEIDALLRRRHLASNTHHCPHGRPAALVFSKNDLERQFGRV